jgi:hypothetical protein
MLKNGSEEEGYLMDVLWQESYKAAMLELDPVKRGQRIEAAHAAIQRRKEELTKEDRRGSCQDEQQALAEALPNLRALNRVGLKSSTQSRMKRRCREPLTPSWRRRKFECAELLRHVRVVTDPKKLAYLNAEVERRAREEQAESKRNRT